MVVEVLGCYVCVPGMAASSPASRVRLIDTRVSITKAQVLQAWAPFLALYHLIWLGATNWKATN